MHAIDTCVNDTCSNRGNNACANRNDCGRTLFSMQLFECVAGWHTGSPSERHTVHVQHSACSSNCQCMSPGQRKLRKGKHRRHTHAQIDRRCFPLKEFRCDFLPLPRRCTTHLAIYVVCMAKTQCIVSIGNAFSLFGHRSVVRWQALKTFRKVCVCICSSIHCLHAAHIAFFADRRYPRRLLVDAMHT